MNTLNVVESIFFAALEKETPEARAAYLDEACKGDVQLRSCVEKLLNAHPRAEQFLQAPAPGPAATAEPPAIEERPGTVIGPYKLLQQLGEGGFGVVFLAEQSEPVRRKVALKIIKPGMDSRQVVARFEAERQALALMDHPNIARVFDGGTTDSGRPYFVMELVKGVPITEFCDQNRLTPRERLELFVPVCQAVQHAHQKGIIHRDLKPSNVLVTLYDDKPVPKVIDFGVAKATEQKLTEQTLFTRVGQVVGTLEYMSPEQASLNALDVDTRSDVYALGVLLYELLTGSTPLGKEQLQGVAFLEMLRLIRETEPPRPSTRLSQLGGGLSLMAAYRKTESQKLPKLMRGELDWITMKALEKDRDRRYETANGLARDVERYLRDEPVQARPPSAWYRFRKMARRNRAAVTAAAVVVVALLVGTVGLAASTLWALHMNEQTEQALAKVDQARQKAEKAAEEERQAKILAEERRQHAEAVARLLESVFKNLDPFKEGKSGLDLKEQLTARLDKAAEQLKQEAADPLTQARLQHALGEALVGLGEPNKAIFHLERARKTYRTLLGDTHKDTLLTANRLALAYLDSGKADLAVPLLKERLARLTDQLGVKHYDTLVAQDNLASAYQETGRLDLAIPLFEESLRILMDRHGGLRNPITVACMNDLASAYRAAGQFKRAIQLFKKVVEQRKFSYGPDHPRTLVAMNNLGSTYNLTRQFDLALPPLEEALPKMEVKLGPNHHNTIRTRNNLAAAYEALGKRELALSLFKESYERAKAKLGLDHPDTLRCLITLARAYFAAGTQEQALSLLDEALKAVRGRPGADHRYTIRTLHDLGEAYQALGKRELALSLFKESYERAKARLGQDHPDTLRYLRRLASAYSAAGTHEQALPLLEQALKEARGRPGAEHRGTIRIMYVLAGAYVAAGKHDQAVPLLEEALAKARKSPGLAPQNLALIQSALVASYEKAGEFARAESLCREDLQLIEKKYGASDPMTANAQALLGWTLLRHQKFTEAEPVLRDCLKTRQQLQPDAWTTLNTQAMLGGSLLGQKKYTEAEPLLLAGYAGMKARVKSIPPQSRPRLTEAAQRLVELYETLGNEKQAGIWRQQLEDLSQGSTTENKDR
jgi:serine/threonine protein kinase